MQKGDASDGWKGELGRQKAETMNAPGSGSCSPSAAELSQNVMYSAKSHARPGSTLAIPPFGVPSVASGAPPASFP